MSKVKVLIVEDNRIVAADIAATLQQIGYEISGMLAKGEDVKSHIEKEKPDVILMDVNLEGEMDGIDVSKKVLEEYQLPVIFLTANSDKETFERAKETKPYAFILKPFDRFDIEHSIELAMSRFAQSQEHLKEEEMEEADASPTFVLKDRIFVKSKDAMIKIFLDDILWIEADNNYCFLHTPQKKHLITVNLKRMEAKLVHPNFMRVHRSYIINLEKLDKVGEFYLSINNQDIPISKSYRPELIKRLQMI